jgi:hypothetical protein
MKDVLQLRRGLSFAALVRGLVAAGLLVLCIDSIHAQQVDAAKRIPVMDGGAGPCSVEFTVTDIDGHPVYAAVIAVHFGYGFGGVRKLDLQAETNFDGKARFTGLPEKVKGGTMYFRASQGDRSGSVFYNPAKDCTKQEGIVIAKQP